MTREDWYDAGDMLRVLGPVVWRVLLGVGVILGVVAGVLWWPR